MRSRVVLSGGAICACACKSLLVRLGRVLPRLVVGEAGTVTVVGGR